MCNHRSSVDPFILSASTRRIISFLIAEEYYKIPLFRTLFNCMGCIPVKRDLKDVVAVRKTIKSLEEGSLICIFPEGGINRGIEHSKLGVGYLLVRSGATAIPACIVGTPETSSVWRALFTPSHAAVRFGTPYQPPELLHDKFDRRLISQVTAEIMAAVESLAQE